ncbi:MAG: hypothetical protein IKI88_07950 [Anaerotignum sp.]|nr:hypothetical protein [Anaerotignum sp.]
MSKKGILWARTVTLVTALAFIGMGAHNGEWVAVLQKAVRICLECIGIG